MPNFSSPGKGQHNPAFAIGQYFRHVTFSITGLKCNMVYDAIYSLCCSGGFAFEKAVQSAYAAPRKKEEPLAGCFTERAQYLVLAARSGTDDHVGNISRINAVLDQTYGMVAYLHSVNLQIRLRHTQRD